MKKIFLVFICLILFIWCRGVSAFDEQFDSAKQAFDMAYEKYGSGDYDGAVSGFRSMLDSGLKSGNILYNLGNSYLKSGKLGYAILSYEQARLFIPRDSDLISNYQYARALVKQKESPVKKSFLAVGLDSVFSYLTLGETYFLFMALYYFVVTLIIVCVFISQLRKYLIPSIVILCVLWFSVSLPLAGKMADTARLGVVVSDIADVRFEPSERAAINFPLYAGMRANILSTKGEWRKIKRLDGKIGWVERSSILPIAEESQRI